MAAVHPVQAGYAAVFGLTAVVCFVAIARARDRIEDRDTRWGLVSLLVTSGLWATFHVGRLLAPGSGSKVAFYVLGLLAGLATVGAWLYFCSAYAGRPYHRQPLVRWTAVGIYVAIASVKLTSPVHGLYFSTVVAQTPFVHLEIRLGVLHWIVTGLAYALSAVGFYVLFDLFRESDHATKRLGVLVGLAGLPVVFDLIGYASSGVVITMNYEPIGVGLFALGVLYVADGSFLAVRRFGREQLLDELEEGIVLLDADGTVRDVNAAARRLFPGLEGALGEPVATAAPELDAYLPVEEPRVVEFGTDPPRYALLSAPELAAGQVTVGQALVFTDITEVERQRRELARRQAQMDDFAAAITHELRNSLNIVQGHLGLVEAQLDPGTDVSARDSVATATETVDRMSDIVGDLATLARFGGTVETTTGVDVGTIARRAREVVVAERGEFELIVERSHEIEADVERLEQLFENLFRFAVENGATRVAVTVDGNRLVVTDDGEPLAESDVEAAFTYGQAVPDAESGMVLPVVRTLAESHGWTVTVDTGYEDGVRTVVTQSANGG